MCAQSVLTLKRPPAGALPTLVDATAVSLVFKLLSPHNVLKVGC